ncbi:MAG TPA: ABC transporter ATP-binding protein, partial [Kandleria vitulina]|nr:ABC transporter ATP-binding protein [Kandleria vitulina]
MEFLVLKNVKKSYGQDESLDYVLKGIDLCLNKGELCVMLGPSGCG